MSVEVGVKPLGGVLASEVVSVCCVAQAGTTGVEVSTREAACSRVLVGVRFRLVSSVCFLGYGLAGLVGLYVGWQKLRGVYVGVRSRRIQAGGTAPAGEKRRTKCCKLVLEVRDGERGMARAEPGQTRTFTESQGHTLHSEQAHN